MKYKLLTASAAIEMTTTVERHLKKGFKLKGGTFSGIETYSGIGGQLRQRGVIYQAITKVE